MGNDVASECMFYTLRGLIDPLTFSLHENYSELFSLCKSMRVCIVMSFNFEFL